jgi:hypothetical protein
MIDKSVNRERKHETYEFSLDAYCCFIIAIRLRMVGYRLVSLKYLLYQNMFLIFLSAEMWSVIPYLVTRERASH